jgi:hypothetical protein
MLAGQGELQVVLSSGCGKPHPLGSHLQDLDQLGGEAEIGSQLRGHSPDGCGRLRVLQPDQGRTAGPERARLFPRDGRERLPQIFAVLQTDGGDQRQLRLADVRGVQPASHSDLHDGEVDLALGEPEEGGGGDCLEVGRRLGFNDSFEQRAEILGTDGLAVNAQPLLDRLQMGGSIESGLEARGGGHGGEQGRGRALAVAASDQDRAVVELGIAVPGEELADALQPEPDAQLLQAGEDLLGVQGR